MTEPVRLVIWDLDETFWTGTVTEGGHQYQRHAHDMVIELARRGIMSSICSKNDFSTIRTILEAEGIWEYFIFPSIDWSPKGPRVAAIIEAVQLRAATVMFIDDNLMNLNEAKHVTPDLQIADEKVIPTLLDHPLLKGKDDRELTRLAQYKLLEKRSADQVASGGDNSEFLRASNIRVVIEHDVEQHIDRCIELINRTNQLNFTKKRLPEDLETARQKFRATYVSTWRMQIGLVRVIDQYGDYGYCGFYAYDAFLNSMEDFCFSCRILGMGVEQWLYGRLGKPKIIINGEVLSDLTPKVAVDWIKLSQSNNETGSDVALIRLGSVFLHGGCELTAVSHYLSLVSENVVGEYNVMVAGHQQRWDHSIFLRYGIEGLSSAAVGALNAVGYDITENGSKLKQLVETADVFVFSFSADAKFALYRHQDTGVEVPLQMGIPGANLTYYSDEQVKKLFTNPNNRRIMTNLREQYKYIGLIEQAPFMRNVAAVMSAVGPDKPVIFFSAFEGHRPGDIKKHAELNQWLKAASDSYKNVILLDIRDCIQARSEVISANHFHRNVYHRMADKVVELAEGFSPTAGVLEQVEHRNVLDTIS